MRKTKTIPGSRSLKRTARIELERRGDAVPARFPVTISTDAPIVRRDFDGEFEEILSHDGNAIDLSRAPLPVIESHNRGQVNIGVVENLRVERDGKLKKLRGYLVLGQQARAQELAVDIAAGIVSNISVGCTVEESEEEITGKDRKRKIVATRWTPHEVSIVSVPADTSAGIGRALTKGQSMKKNNKNDRTRAATSDDTDADDFAHDIENEEAEDGGDGDQLRLATRAAPRSVRSERTRASTIIQLVRSASLSDSLAEELIRDGVSLRDAREVIIDTMAADQHRTQRVIRGQHDASYSFGNDHASPQSIERAMGEALFSRINPSHKPSEQAQQFVGRSMVDLARECLHAANINTRSMGPSKIIERALGGAYHGVSDFTGVLGNLLGRELLRAYEHAGPGVLLAGRSVTASDFRARYPVRLGDGPRLEKVNEHGEFRSGTIREAAEPAWKLDTFGKMFGLTRQAIVNDDLGAFNNVPRLLGIAAREHETQMVVDLLVSNGGAGPTMGSGSPLFHANHGNLASSGGVLSVTTLGAARSSMRLQKSLEGRPINIVPRYLIVPAAIETAAEQLLTAIEATKHTDVNPFSGKLELIVDPRLDSASSTKWYLAGDPGRFDGLEYAYLAGESGPQVEVQSGWRVDGVEWKVRLDFGCGFVSSAAWYTNPGAAPG